MIAAPGRRSSELAAGSQRLAGPPRGHSGTALRSRSGPSPSPRPPGLAGRAPEAARVALPGPGGPSPVGPPGGLPAGSVAVIEGRRFLGSLDLPVQPTRTQPAGPVRPRGPAGPRSRAQVRRLAPGLDEPETHTGKFNHIEGHSGSPLCRCPWMILPERHSLMLWKGSADHSTQSALARFALRLALSG